MPIAKAQDKFRFFSVLFLKSIPSYAFLDIRSSECTRARKSTCLFQESFNVITIFLQLRHFLLDVFQELRVGLIKSKLPCMASTCCCDLLSQLN